ncbi:MAG: hypothetical protein GY748_18070, partial [Planctomycetaceae bacterium]|nr:hypothetical protein [Planctomycetaceae bacterium]
MTPVPTHSPMEAGEVRSGIDENMTGGKNMGHRKRSSTIGEKMGDEIADNASGAETERGGKNMNHRKQLNTIEKAPEKYLQRYAEYEWENNEEQNEPWRTQRIRKPIQPINNTTPERPDQRKGGEKPTEEDVLILELIIGIFDVTLRSELIRRASDTDYMGLVEVAKAWYSTKSAQAATMSEETNRVDGLTEEKAQMATLYNGGSNGNEETNVNLRQELHRELSDETKREIVTGTGAQPDTESIRKRPRDKYRWATTIRQKGCMKPGDEVSTQNMKTRQWTEKATIISEQRGGWSYEVEINGKRRTRSRRFLRKIARFDGVHTPEIGGADDQVCTSTRTLDESCIQSNTNNGHGSTHIATITANCKQLQPGTVI